MFLLSTTLIVFFCLHLGVHSNVIPPAHDNYPPMTPYPRPDPLPLSARMYDEYDYQPEFPNFDQIDQKIKKTTIEIDMDDVSLPKIFRQMQDDDNKSLNVQNSTAQEHAQDNQPDSQKETQPESQEDNQPASQKHFQKNHQLPEGLDTEEVNNDEELPRKPLRAMSSAIVNPAAFYLRGAQFDSTSAPKCELMGCEGPYPNDGMMRLSPSGSAENGRTCHHSWIPLNPCVRNQGYPVAMLCTVCCQCTDQFVAQMRKTVGFSDEK